MAASNGDMPSSCLCLANSTIKNRVLAREADEHDQADLREDVVVAAFEPDAGDGEQQTHRHDQNDGERQAETFVLRGEHEEHEQQAERIDIDRRVAGEDALVGQVGPFICHAVGQIVVGEFGHERFGLAGTVSRARARR